MDFQKSLATMGCVASKAELGDSASHVFRVWNVNQEGNVLAPGHLELTEAELVLHQRGREPIHWPMRCLRRYGFDAELFSFESGRRCPTGPGVYAFKCRRADQLFNLLQEQIQAHGQEEQSHGSGGVPRSASVSEGAYLEPVPVPGIPKPRGSIRTQFSLPNSLSSSSTGLLSPGARTGSPHYANEEGVGPRAPTPQHEYVNSTALVESEMTDDDNYAKLDDLLKKERLYINVKPEVVRDLSYANVLPTLPHCAPQQMPVAAVSGMRLMNYVVLDLDKVVGGGSEAGGGTTPTSPLSLTSLPESPERNGEGYATIDFERTAALSCTNASGGASKDESQRKTRHNSTISDLILSRHNSAVSE